MESVQEQLHAIALVPAIVNSIEDLFGPKRGAEKKESAMAFVLAAISLRECVARGEIVDEDLFRTGLGKMIDGAVECMKASVWARSSASGG